MYWKACAAEVPSVSAVIVELIISPLESGSARAAALGREGLFPESLDVWLASCLDRDPIGRYPTATDAVQLLTALGTTIPTNVDIPSGTAVFSGDQTRGPTILAQAISEVVDTGVVAVDSRPSAYPKPTQESIPVPADVPALRPQATATPMTEFLELQVARVGTSAQKAEVAMRIGRVYEVSEGEQELARKAFERALEFVPTHSDAWRGLRQIYRSQKQWSSFLETTRNELDVCGPTLSKAKRLKLQLEILRALPHAELDTKAVEQLLPSLEDADAASAELAHSATLDFACVWDAARRRLPYSNAHLSVSMPNPRSYSPRSESNSRHCLARSRAPASWTFRVGRGRTRTPLRPGSTLPSHSCVRAGETPRTTRSNAA